jgi:hypothetical protein
MLEKVAQYSTTKVCNLLDAIASEDGEKFKVIEEQIAEEIGVEAYEELFNFRIMPALSIGSRQWLLSEKCKNGFTVKNIHPEDQGIYKDYYRNPDGTYEKVEQEKNSGRLLEDRHTSYCSQCKIYDASDGFVSEDIEKVLDELKEIVEGSEPEFQILFIIENAHYLTAKAAISVYECMRDYLGLAVVLVVVSTEKTKVFPPLLSMKYMNLMIEKGERRNKRLQETEQRLAKMQEEVERSDNE